MTKKRITGGGEGTTRTSQEIQDREETGNGIETDGGRRGGAKRVVMTVRSECRGTQNAVTRRNGGTRMTAMSVAASHAGERIQVAGTGDEGLVQDLVQGLPRQHLVPTDAISYLVVDITLSLRHLLPKVPNVERTQNLQRELNIRSAILQPLIQTPTL